MNWRFIFPDPRGNARWLFRLPTETEWEQAARGPDGFDYGLGMELSEPQAGFYNWRKNPDAAVTLVDRQTSRQDYRPNRYGVFHASGNAREWTQSVFRPAATRRNRVPARAQQRRPRLPGGRPARRREMTAVIGAPALEPSTKGTKNVYLVGRRHARGARQ